MDKVEKDLALLAANGDVMYPYKKTQKGTGREGFALSAPGDGDRHGGGVYTADIAEVIRKVVFDGWNVRATTVDGRRHGSYGIGKRAIRGYAVASRLRHLVKGAPIEPSPHPTEGPSAS